MTNQYPIMLEQRNFFGANSGQASYAKLSKLSDKEYQVSISSGQVFENAKEKIFYKGASGEIANKLYNELINLNEMIKGEKRPIKIY